MQDKRRRYASCVRGAGCPVDRAVLAESAGRHRSAGSLEYRPRLDPRTRQSSRDAAAAAWHAEPVVRFFCSTYGGGIAGVRVSEDSFIVITAEVPGNELVEVTIAVGPDGTCACKVCTAHRQAASAAPDTRSLEQVLSSRLARRWEYGAKPALVDTEAAGPCGPRGPPVMGGEGAVSRRPSTLAGPAAQPGASRRTSGPAASRAPAGEPPSFPRPPFMVSGLDRGVQLC